MYKKKNREPNFTNLERVLQKRVPERPVLFEFILGDSIKRFLTDGHYASDTDEAEAYWTMQAFYSAGYDHCPVVVRGMEFLRGELDETHATKSLNEGGLIADCESFTRYPWPSLKSCDFGLLDRLGEKLPKGMRFVPFSHDGILENTIAIVGYEALCLMLYDDPKLLASVFHEVGQRIHDYFIRCLAHDNVGAVLLNDDWGFKSQTMLPPDVLRKHVFPWYAAVAKEAHRRGKYVILHSCGHFEAILDDMTGMLALDGKHSYEDNILPVEDAYELLKGRVAVIGGLDVDFLCRSTPKEIFNRARKMLMRSAENGGYALGSGNSIPDYVPLENYLAMLDAAFEKDE